MNIIGEMNQISLLSVTDGALEKLALSLCQTVSVVFIVHVWFGAQTSAGVSAQL